MQIFRVKPGNQREGGRERGREGGREGERGREGTRAKPGNQLVNNNIAHHDLTIPVSST